MEHLVEIGQTVVLEPNYVVGTLRAHTGFLYMSPPIAYELPDGHNVNNDVKLSALPFLVDRTDAEALERSLLDSVHELAAMISDHCTQHVLSLKKVETVEASDLDEWLSSSVSEIRNESRSHCGVDLLVDTELDSHYSSEYHESRWRLKKNSEAFVYGIERRQPLRNGLFAIVGLQHGLGIHSHIQVFLTSRQDPMGEVWTLSISFPYRPELSSSFEHVRVARVEK